MFILLFWEVFWYNINFKQLRDGIKALQLLNMILSIVNQPSFIGMHY